MIKLQPIGYEALIRRYHIETIPHWHISFIAIENHTQKIEREGDRVRETYPKRYAVDNKATSHLEFALKYDGVNLTLLKQIFEQIEEEEIITYIQDKPTGKYARRLWYFYEFLMSRELPIEDLKQGNYVDLLETNRYYTISNPQSIKRQRVRDNLLGDNSFCPIVRKTEKLKAYEALNLSQKSIDIVTNILINFSKEH